jgi:hypothetical protein
MSDTLSFNKALERLDNRVSSSQMPSQLQNNQYNKLHWPQFISVIGDEELRRMNDLQDISHWLPNIYKASVQYLIHIDTLIRECGKYWTLHEIMNEEE